MSGVQTAQPFGRPLDGRLGRPAAARPPRPTRPGELKVCRWFWQYLESHGSKMAPLPAPRHPGGVGGSVMKMKTYESFDDYLADQKPKNQTIIRALRQFVKR